MNRVLSVHGESLQDAEGKAYSVKTAVIALADGREARCSVDVRILDLAHRGEMKRIATAQFGECDWSAVEGKI